MEAFFGILIPFIRTTLSAACVLFMKRSLGDLVQRSLAGFAAGVMVAASVWILIIPAIEQSADLGSLFFVPVFVGFWAGVLFLPALDHAIAHLHVGARGRSRAKSGRRSFAGKMLFGGVVDPAIERFSLHQEDARRQGRSVHKRVERLFAACKRLMRHCLP